MSDPSVARLRRLAAPDALCSWAQQRSSSSEPPRAYRLWWRGAQGDALDPLLADEQEALLAAIEALLGPSELQPWLERAAARDVDHEALAGQVAERVEVVTSGYRESPAENVLAGFAALGWLLRASGAVETARARRFALRENRARELAALIGAGHSAFLRDADGLRVDTKDLESPVNSELAYAFSCFAEAHKALQAIGVQA